MRGNSRCIDVTDPTGPESSLRPVIPSAWGSFKREKDTWKPESNYLPVRGHVQELLSFQHSSFFRRPTTKQTIPARKAKKKWPDDSFVSTISTDQHQSSVSCPAIISMDRFQCLLPWLPTAPISNSITAITLNGRNDLKKKTRKAGPAAQHKKNAHFFRYIFGFEIL
jgi:hypothetical protein